MDERYLPYPTYKPSGVDWLGEIPSHWDVRRLKSAIAFAVNGAWGDEPQNDDNDLVCIRVADFDYENLAISTQNLTVRNIPQPLQSRRLLQTEDLLIEKSGGGDIWSVGRVVSYTLNVKAVSSNFIARLVVNRNVDSRYLCYLFAAAYSGGLNVRSIKQTTGIQNLDLQSYLDEKFGLPHLREQRAIAVYLDRETAHIDALIARKRELLDLLERQRAAIISHAVTKGLNPAAPLKYSGIPWLGEIPSHWEVSRLKWFVRKIGSGKTPRGGADNYVSDGVLFIRSQNVHFTGLRLDDVVYITESTNQEMASSQIKGNDVLLNITGASLGRCSLVPEDFPPANVNQHVCIIRTRPESLLPRLLNYSLMSYPMQAQIFASEDGISREGLNFQSIGNMAIALPPSIGEQSQLCAFLEYETARIDKLIEEIAGSIELLQRYRTALISAAVTGKMDVRGA